jgi:hypothetical protein
MMGEKPPEDVQHWTSPPFIDPKIEKPPVGARIDKDVICRSCMTVAEEIAMRRGFIDLLSPKQAEEKDYICTRCGKKISAGP